MLSPELTTLLVGASPISEVRGAIPLAIGAFHFTALKAYGLGVLGNILPVLPLLLFWRYAAGWVRRLIPVFDRFFTWLFERTRRLHEKKFQTWEVLALFIFVAIPLPLTGVWTASVAAFLFDIPFWKSFFAISLGAAAAGAIVLAATIGVITVF